MSLGLLLGDKLGELVGFWLGLNDGVCEGEDVGT